MRRRAAAISASVHGSEGRGSPTDNYASHLGIVIRFGRELPGGRFLTVGLARAPATTTSGVTASLNGGECPAVIKSREDVTGRNAKERGNLRAELQTSRSRPGRQL